MWLLYSPFEQFEIILLNNFNIFNTNIQVTNINILLFFVVAVILVYSRLILNSFTFIPNNWQISLELFYHLVFSVVKSLSTKRSYPYIPQLATFFLLVLLSNLEGLTPFGFTITSHIIVTFTLALSIFFSLIIMSITQLGLQFLRQFCPRNMPLWLIPLLILIEIMSYCLRPISLGVRLFANMLAGHILLHILTSAFTYLLQRSLLLAIPALTFVIAVFLLEIGIALLQAYIFLVLIIIYQKDTFIAH